MIANADVCNYPLTRLELFSYWKMSTAQLAFQLKSLQSVESALNSISLKHMTLYIRLNCKLNTYKSTHTCICLTSTTAMRSQDCHSLATVQASYAGVCMCVYVSVLRRLLLFSFYAGAERAHACVSLSRSLSFCLAMSVCVCAGTAVFDFC